MMHPDNVGQQFKDHVLVHRGIPQVGPEAVKSDLGIHWSHNIEVAKKFATPSAYEQDYEDNGSQGVVVSALVHKKHIIEPHSPEWHDAQNLGSALNNEIYEPEHWEEEATVRPNSPVNVVAVQHTFGAPDSTEWKSRRMSYKTPRKSQS